VIKYLNNAPESDFAIDALVAWEPYEDTGACWNPLATTWKMNPVCYFNCLERDSAGNCIRGVQSYQDQEMGVQATANTLNQSYYDAIRKMLRLEAFDREALRTALSKWGTCSGTRCDPLLNKWQELWDRHYGHVPPAPIPSQLSTVLVFDNSGSMNDQDVSGRTKWQAAQAAGGNILDIIAAENQAQGSDINRVAIVEFNTTAKVDIPLSADISAVRTVLQGIQAGGSTAMPDGLRTALDVLYADTSWSKANIILLSDGLPNVGLGGDPSLPENEVKQQVLDLATEAGQRGISIYTVGFGIPGTPSIDEEFLKQVSRNSGGGSYYSAQNAIQLANAYVDVWHTSTGTVLLRQSGQIAQGQQINIGSIQVPNNQSRLLFTLNWPGSRLDPLLIDPRGKPVDASYTGAFISSTLTLASIIVRDPQAGSWQVGAYGADVPEGVTTYQAIVSTQARTTPLPETKTSALPVIFALLTVAGGGLIIYTFSRRRPRLGQMAIPAASLTKAQLIRLSGEMVPPTVSLQTTTFTIGRGSACDLRLSDPRVSRQHARLQYAQGAWYIQDMGSKGGTYVNGQRVQAIRLQPGDHITIGTTTWTFVIGNPTSISQK